ncbi:MAG TPA: PadR family transcriptional regulator [Jatrophihabitantaceae bacterium]|nr:PadR family transcriptional regulator [Jatrophihabitantaceae bacterium]
MSIRYGLLSLLERRPMYGYQLRQEFEASTGATWPLNVGQVYSTLARLERDGLVAVSDDETADADRESQRVYAITDNGRAEVRTWFATPVRNTSPPRDELAIKLALAVHTPGVDVHAVIQAQRTATVRALQEYTRAREAAADDLSWLLVADSLIFAAEAEVRWLDHCETRLARAARTRTDAASAKPAGSVRREDARS